jgi:hypothetical protein
MNRREALAVMAAGAVAPVATEPEPAMKGITADYGPLWPEGDLLGDTEYSLFSDNTVINYTARRAPETT